MRVRLTVYEADTDKVLRIRETNATVTTKPGCVSVTFDTPETIIQGESLRIEYLESIPCHP